MFCVDADSCKFTVYKWEKKWLTSTDAVTRVREFIKLKHRKFKRITFSGIYQDGDFWVLRGEVEYKQTHFFTKKKSFVAKVHVNTGDITPYNETRLQRETPIQKD